MEGGPVTVRKLLWAFLAVLGIAVVGVAYLARSTLASLHSPIAALTQPQSYEIPKGTSFAMLARDLGNRGWIESPRLLVAWARLTGQGKNLKAGEYEVLPGMSPQALVDLFTSGRVLLHSITFIEGSTFDDMRQALARHPDVKQELQGATDAEVMRRLGAPDRHPEGLFFPDTYRFPKGTTDLDVMRLAYDRMQRELEAAWASRAPDLPLASAYEALILASIIEKETARESERPKIGGVFVERLRRQMRLQTDPTVIYGLDDSYDGNLRRADLQRDTPYNTYTRAGLPPTPIALPGLAALQAAVHPDVTGALFFVATGLGDGSHYFSRTLAEHDAAVARYLQRLRQQ
jgi:UPF0755 protein